MSKIWFFIRKSSRDSLIPYEGITCDQAGVTPGQYYPTYEAALADAEKLSQHNPVGFDVDVIRPSELLHAVENLEKWLSAATPK